MTRGRLLVPALCALSALLLSLPWLVPHAGALALVAFVPLLWAEDLAGRERMRGTWLCPAAVFTAWNAATTFWVCNATLGGGIFAILANAAQMLLVWLLFRLAKKKMGGVLPYLFLAAMWIAWERRYFSAEVSWPWLTLGGAFAQSTRMVQWYEYTGMLGGSLWVWTVNLGIYGLLAAAADGRWQRWRSTARTAALLGMTLAVTGPLLASKFIGASLPESPAETLDVVIGQPNFDPYQKFTAMSQQEQTAVLLEEFARALEKRPAGRPVLLIAPETFTGDVFVDRAESSPTVRAFRDFLALHPGAELLFGASTYELFGGRTAPSRLARPYGEAWIVSHNSAVLTAADGPVEFYHKSKLVPGVELTPWPRLFVPLDDWLSAKLGVSGLMGRCAGQDAVSLLHFGAERVPLGCAVCYESIYGEYCADYVRAGAQALTVITNDAWWGDTPGYRQHLSYARLRAIELRRDIARCGNTGISCLIDRRGEVLERTEWWTRGTLSGEISLHTEQTAFVRYGDIVGRVCTLVFLLLAAMLFVRMFLPRT